MMLFLSFAIILAPIHSMDNQLHYNKIFESHGFINKTKKVAYRVHIHTNYKKSLTLCDFEALHLFESKTKKVVK